MSLGLNHQTVTTGNVFRPDIWSRDIVRFYESNLILANKVKRYDQEVAQRGKTVQIPKLSELTANDKIANTQVTLQAPTETSVTLTMDQHKECSFIIEDMLGVQANYNLLSEYTSAAGYAVKKAVDTSLANLATGFSQTTGTYNTTITTAVTLAAVQALDDVDVPMDRCWVLKPHAVADLRSIADYTRYDGTGYAGGAAHGGIGDGAKPRPNGLCGMLYNSPVYMTTQIAQTGNNISNMYFNRDALALAIQSSPRVQSQYKQEYLGTLVTADVLYGVVEVRNEAGLEFKN